MIYFGDFVTVPTGIQYVGGKTANGAVTSSSISLTDLTGGLASAPAAGDIVIVAWAVSTSSNTTPPSAPSGYTQITDLYADDTYDANLGLYYKIMPSTPDTSFTLPGTSNSAFGTVVGVHVWRGVNTTTPLDVTTTTATGINTLRPNPPSITPITSGAVIIAAGAGSIAGMPTFTSSDLSNFRTAANNVPSFGATIGIGSFAWTSGAFDPAGWGSSGDSTQGSWCAATIALRPA